MSEDEEENSDAASEAFFFASASPSVATTVTVNAPPEPQYASSEGESGSVPLPQDYAENFADAQRPVSEPSESRAKADSSLFAESSGIPERDLDVPTFLRRLKF